MVDFINFSHADDKILDSRPPSCSYTPKLDVKSGVYENFDQKLQADIQTKDNNPPTICLVCDEPTDTLHYGKGLS